MRKDSVSNGQQENSQETKCFQSRKQIQLHVVQTSETQKPSVLKQSEI